MKVVAARLPRSSVVLEGNARALIHVRTSIMHDVLDVLGDAWALRILYQVGGGSTRFATLLERLDIPRATLAGRLRTLIGERCLEKATYSNHAARFEYRLTVRGRDALPAIALLRQWNRRRAPDSSPASTPAFVHRCGARLELEAICGSCARPIIARDVKALDFEPISLLEKLPAPPKVRRGRNVLEAAAQEAAGAPLVITAEDCIGDPWASLVIGTMMFGLHRFGEIETAIAIAPNILSSRLRLLTRVGIAQRNVTSASRATYHLTAKGQALFPAIMALCAWGDRWLRAPSLKSAGKKSPGKHVVSWGLLHRPCGEWLRTAVICKPCGCELTGAELMKESIT